MTPRVSSIRLSDAQKVLVGDFYYLKPEVATHMRCFSLPSYLPPLVIIEVVPK
jgi:hypothetical protein